MRSKSFEDRFWDKVLIPSDVSRCWEWTAYKSEFGYGRIRNNYSDSLAHRVSHELVIGPIQNEMSVCHKCDNPSCVNPNHLFLGTDADNVADKVLKCRQSKCDSHGRAKLSHEQVRHIRDVYTGERGQLTKLAREFGVVHATIWRVLQGFTWS